MKRLAGVLVLAVIALLAQNAVGQEEKMLTRDEVSVIKKKLVAILGALGTAKGYDIENEHFNLPTDAYPSGQGNLYYPVNASAARRYGTQKSAEKSAQDLQKEYQKKMLEAQAKGDYQTMAKLAQEMQQKAGEQQLKGAEQAKEPIDVDVQLNSNPGATIDPDAVLFEKAGLIAVKSIDESNAGKERIWIYFDPVNLKDTKQLSRVDLKLPDGGVAKRNIVLNATIELQGPTADVEALAKQVDTHAVLGQIDPLK